MNTPCHCPFCKAGQAHPATPDHGTYEPAGPRDMACTLCGHLLPGDEVAPA